MMSGRISRNNRASSKTKILRPGATLKPSREHSQSTFDTAWADLEASFRAIHNHTSSNLFFEQIYRAVYRISIEGKAARLAEKVQDLEEEMLLNKVLPQLRSQVPENIGQYLFSGVDAVESQKQASSEQTLEAFRSGWSEYLRCISLVADACIYMNTCALRDSNRVNILETVIGMFRDNVFSGDLHGYTVNDILQRIILDQIKRERQGCVVDKMIIKSAVEIYARLREDEKSQTSACLYDSRLFPLIQKESIMFYQDLCDKLLADENTPAWMLQCFECIRSEERRADTYLLASSSKELLQVIQEHLISRHLQQFINCTKTGLPHMIRHQEFENIEMLWSLERLVDPSNAMFCISIQDTVTQLGMEMQSELDRQLKENNAPQNEESDYKKVSTAASLAQSRTVVAIGWVQHILSLEKNFDHIVEKCCAHDVKVQSEIGKGFSKFINKNSRATEFISLYIDEIFRQASGVNDQDTEIEQKAANVVKLIKYLHQKDEFQAYYHKHLARRALSRNQEQLDLEYRLITKMKQDLGQHFTTHFEKMFKDLQLSADINWNYQLSNFNRQHETGIDISVSILTNGSWPNEVLGLAGREDDKLAAEKQNDTVNIWPAEVSPDIDSITKYYTNQHEGRQLRWCPTVGSVDMKCHFPGTPGKIGLVGRKRSYDLNVSIYGMRVLLLFNNATTASQGLTFDAIRKETSIPSADLARTLMSLWASAKCRLLLKTPPTKSIKPTDTFVWNRDFVSKTVKIKAKAPTSGGAKVEDDAARKLSEKRQAEQRGYQIDAAVVRVMKQRKTCQHSALVSEVIRLLAGSFKPEVSQIKKQIDMLIDKDYMDRMEDTDVPTYLYIS